MSVEEGNGSGDGPSSLEQKIIKQIEYYFGDVNLQRDKFLREQIKKEDGWVTLDVLITFNRLKSLSDNFEFICNALKKSQSGLMEVSDDNKKIRRSPSTPLPVITAEKREHMKTRSVYAKGFPLDTTLDAVQDFLDTYGDVELVQMRKDVQKKFKGSIFAMFKTKDAAEKFVKAESIKYQENELLRLFKEKYFEKKAEEKKDKAKNQKHQREEEKQKRADEEKDKLKEKITEGAVLQLTALASDTSREDIKDVFEKYGKISWVDFSRGETVAHVRFQEKDQAKTALEKATEAGDGKVIVKETEVTTKVLEGDEELTHWKEVFRQLQERKDKRHKKFSGRGRGGRRGGRGDRKRKMHDDDDGSNDSGDDDQAPKQAKTQ